jgi:hypothetical protein
VSIPFGFTASNDFDEPVFNDEDEAVFDPFAPTPWDEVLSDYEEDEYDEGYA